jgi:Mrp family chromosome partitioning ATPase
MSKNFELIPETEIDPEVIAAATAFRLATGNGNGNGKKHGSRLPVDKTTQEESLKLVQRVFLLQAAAPRTVVFAGIDQGNGCSQICARAAEVLANSVSGSVCLVDANLRSPHLPDLFAVSNHRGLTDALLQEGPIKDYAKRLHPGNLWLLSCGSLAAEFCGFLSVERLKIRIAELRNEFDYVLIDAPPLNLYSDATALGQLADGLIIVLEANVTRRETALRVSENLRTTQVQVLGTVLNKRTFPIPEALYQRL